ncbi:MAG: hypothetical protein U0527_09160 [Candidatus Eisenbacteria bacterium]
MNPALVIEAHGKHPQAVQFTRDGRQLVSAGTDARVRFWSRPDYAPGLVIEGHEKSVNHLALDSDETHLATASSDGTVRVWSLPLGGHLYTLKGMNGAAFHPRHAVLATLSAKNKAVFSATTSGIDLGEEIVADQRLLSLAWSGDGSVLLIGGSGPIHRFGIEVGKGAVVAHPLPALVGHSAFCTSLRLSPDGRLLASTGGDGMLRLWSTLDWSQHACFPIVTRGVLQLAWTPDSERIFVSADHVIHAFRAADGQKLERLELETKGIYGLAVSPDGREFAIACADGKLRLWNLD